MSFVKKINSYLNKTSFLYKTRLILFILIGGMVSICFFTFISLFALKYDHETIFHERVTPIEKVIQIKNLYMYDTYLILQNLSNDEFPIDFIEKKIKDTEDKIDAIWFSYLHPNKENRDIFYYFAHFARWWLEIFGFYDVKTIDILNEDDNVNAINKHKQDFEKELKNIIELKKSGKENVSYESAISSLYKITYLLSSLSEYHINQANNQKLKTDNAFLKTVAGLIILITIVFISSLYATYFTISHIRKLHNYLEFDVKAKTKELENLNSSLEQRIKKEVAVSREKDNILFQQSKLASLGEMLQNIAHQWRQPLGAIMMIIQSFELKYKNGKLTEEFISQKVADAQTLATNMSETLDDFRTFFNPNKSKKEFSLKDVINKSVNLSKYPLEKEKISLHVKEFDDIKFYGFKNELTHVLLNLINNAKDALISRKNDKKIWIIVSVYENSIIIRVIDNAGGVNEKILPQIFEPYFTTKHKSVGTGIGLYMSKQMIEEHMDGKIYCKNIKHKLGSDTLYNCAMFVVEIPLILGKESE